MKNLYWILFLTLLFTSCEKADSIDPEQDLSTNLDLKISKLNSPDTKTYTVNLKDYTNKISNWDNNQTQGTNIKKGIVFNTQLPTGEDLRIEMWLRKIESPQLLILHENATQVDQWEIYKNWDYISYNVKVKNFYNNSVGRSFSINSKTFTLRENFEIVKASEVKIDGESKTRVTIKLKGDLYPFYSNWNAPEHAVYRVDGEFSGIIE